MLFTAWNGERMLKRPDALLGATTQTVLVLAAAVHLALSGCILAGRDPVSQGILAFWAGLSHMFYCVGMVWAGVVPPFPAVQLLGWEVGVRPVVLDGCWKGLIVYLLLGGLLQMLVERRRWKQAEAGAFQKYWREMRRETYGRGAQSGL
jgi:hypothetical protein